MNATDTVSLLQKLRAIITAATSLNENAVWGLAQQVFDACRTAPVAAIQPAGEAVPDCFLPLDTVRYWADEFEKDPQRVAGGMIVRMCKEYAILRNSLAIPAASAPAQPEAKGEIKFPCWLGSLYCVSQEHLDQAREFYQAHGKCLTPVPETRFQQQPPNPFYAAPVPAAPSDKGEPDTNEVHLLKLEVQHQKNLVAAAERTMAGMTVGLPEYALSFSNRFGGKEDCYYSGKQLHQYGAQCILADRARQAAIAQPSNLHATIINLPHGKEYAEWSSSTSARLAYRDGHKDARIAAAALIDAASKERGDAARDVLAERQRQIAVEGWTPEHDDKYHHCELARAAATYAVCSNPDQLMLCGARTWPWREDWFKRATYRRDLIKAGALLLAEIERIDRAAIATTKAAK